MDKIILIACIVGVIAAYLNMQDDLRLRPMEENIAASHCPRVIHFFSSGCNAGQYDSMVANLAGNYGKSIDFEMININDPQNAQLMKMFNVRFAPSTFIFDRYGHQVCAKNGTSTTREVLEKAMKDAVSQK